MTESDRTLEDPGDTEFYLRQNGWSRLSMRGDDNEFWFRKLSAGGNTVPVIIEMKPSGRRKYYVENPPEVFEEAAHDGSCLTNRGIADGESLYRVHFNTRPESLADAVRTLRKMLGGGT